MHCTNCGTENSKDSLFCKKCGYSLVEGYLNSNKDINTNEKKIKNVTKNYNKKKIVNKSIVKNKSKKDKKNKDNVKYVEKVQVVRKMTFFQKFMFFLLILVVLVLIGVSSIMGLYIFSKKTVLVPDVVGMNYIEAKQELENSNLKVLKKEVEGDLDIVLSQNKKSGTYVTNGSSIILTVGVEVEYLPNLLNMSEDAAISILDDYDIQYEIEYVDNEEEVVLYQSYKAGTKISNIKKIKLKIGKVSEKSKTEKDNEVVENVKENKEDDSN